MRKESVDFIMATASTFTFVILRGEFLRLPEIKAALSTIEYRGRASNGSDHATIMKQIDGLDQFPIWAKVGNYGHHFGPDLKIAGASGKTIEITAPWNQIVGIIKSGDKFRWPLGRHG
jgi:hypothetical protein